MGKFKKPKLFLEFVGLPGSGKTAVARKVFEDLTNGGYRCGRRASLFSEQKSRRLDRYIYALYFVFRHPLKTTKLFYFCIKLRKREKFLCLLKAFISQRRAISKKDDIVIYDQGVINAFLCIYQKNNNNFTCFKKLYSSFMGAMPAGLISIEVNFEEAISRVRNREKKDHFTEKLKNKEIEKIFQVYNRNLNKFLSCASDEKSFFTINIDGREGIPENSKRIVTFAREFLSNAK
jgi:thymidylate kinase